MKDLPKIYAVNERILKEIKKKIIDPKQRDFLLEILSYELEHFDEQPVSQRYKDSYLKILNKISFKD